MVEDQSMVVDTLVSMDQDCMVEPYPSEDILQTSGILTHGWQHQPTMVSEDQYKLNISHPSLPIPRLYNH